MSDCQICGSDTDKTFKHHVVPKSEGGLRGETIECCYTCNSQVHMLFNNKELASMSLEDLLASEEMQKYIKWKKKHPGEFKHKSSKRVRDWKKYHR